MAFLHYNVTGSLSLSLSFSSSLSLSNIQSKLHEIFLKRAQTSIKIYRYPQSPTAMLRINPSEVECSYIQRIWKKKHVHMCRFHHHRFSKVMHLKKIADDGAMEKSTVTETSLDTFITSREPRSLCAAPSISEWCLYLTPWQSTWLIDKFAGVIRWRPLAKQENMFVACQ